jgi:hypothetical protein
MNLLGTVAEERTDGPVTVWTGKRWPFEARVRLLPNGFAQGDVSSGGFVLFATEAAAVSPEEVAASIDAASRAIFAQAAWYQAP